MVLVVAALVLLPVVELAMMIQVSSWLGGWQMLALLAMVTVLGVWIVKWQGVGAWARMRLDLAEGRVPAGTLVDGALILAAGVLFVVPGFVSDAAAVLLLIPPIRAACRGVLGRRFRVVSAVHSSSGPGGPRSSVLDAGSRVRPPRPPGSRRPSPPPELGP